MTWQTYCNNFEALLKQNQELTSIRQELFFRIGASKFKAFIRFILYVMLFCKYLIKSNKKIEFLKAQNLYFIDSPTSANLGTLKPLILKDESEKIVLINYQVQKSSSFEDIKHNNTINFQDFYKVYISDIFYLFQISKKTARQMNTSFFIVFPILCRYVFNKNSLEYILSNLKVKNIILSNDTLLTSNTAICLAKYHKINDYTLQHGFLTHFYIPTTTTHYIAWGEKAKKWFEGHNINSTLLPLGTPRLDEVGRIRQNSETIKKLFYKKYKIDEDKKLFFYMSHSQAPEFGLEIHKQNFEALKTVLENKAYQLVVKLHPSEKEDLYNEIFSHYLDKVILLPKDEALHHTIIASTICASAYSTTLVEAMCFEKPTLQMNMTQVKELPDYSKNEGCIAIKNNEELKNILNQDDFTKELERQKEYAHKYFNNLGCASEMILLHIGKNHVN